MLEHESHRVPVTALAFHNHHLFAGIGPFLNIYGKEYAALLESHRVFGSQAIHGFAISNTVLVVWGGHFISIYGFLPSEEKSVLNPVPLATLRAQDLILDISICPFPGPEANDSRSIAAVLTAHNALLLLNLRDPPELCNLTSTSRCILYSANLHWLDSDRVLVASGTVFGEIILWSCSIGDETSTKSVLHQLLTGHDGSIFGVRIFESPPDEDAKPPSLLLASCSDDRTVRVWDISDLPDTPLTPQAAADLSSARETGFGSNIADVLPSQQTNSGHCIAKAWGHISRVWNVRFLASGLRDHLPYLFSFGEDATSHIWKLALPSSVFPDLKGETHSLQHLVKTHMHSGKNIWSSAITADDQDGITVATGGADGSIVLNSHNRPVTPVSDSFKSWSIEIISSVSEPATHTRPDKLRGFTLVGESSLVVSTDSGNVFLVDSQLTRGSNVEFSTPSRWISQEPRLQGYSVVAGVSNLSIAFLAGMDGTVFMFDAKHRPSLRELTRCPGKTAALLVKQLFLPGLEGSHVCLLVTNIESKTATLLHLSRSLRSDEGHNFTIAAEWIIKLPTSFVATSVLLIPADDGREDAFLLILGSRNGAIATFGIPAGGNGASISCGTVLSSIHAKDAVTGLAWVPNERTHSTSGHIFSVGRDGSFVALRVSDIFGNFTSNFVNRTHLPVGTLIEGLHVREDEGSVLCWGFHAKQFVVVDILKEMQTLSVDCGGANRIWKFEPRILAGGNALAWIKASQLCLSAQRHVPLQVCSGGGHGREIKAVAVRPSSRGDSMSHMKMFATGSEDTNIKLWVYDRDSTLQFRCVRTLRKHNTGIQNLQWSMDGQYLFSSGGFEEFFVWKLHSAPLIGVGVVCESSCPAESELPDLRIMSFAARHVTSKNTDSDASEFVVSMVRSDSTLRVYSYVSLPDGGKWNLLSAGNYLTSCLTECMDTSYIHGRVLMTAGTDGYIAMWPTDQVGVEDNVEPAALQWTSRHKTHQNTIHCLVLHWITKDRDCVLVTGGDDNAFAVTRCIWGANVRESPKMATLIIPRAHAAAVTGLEIVRAYKDVVTIATASLDQQLKIWQLHIDATKPGVEGITVKRIQKGFTPVADVQCMAPLECKSNQPAVILCGVGMNVWRHKTREEET